MKESKKKKKKGKDERKPIDITGVYAYVKILIIYESLKTCKI